MKPIMLKSIIKSILSESTDPLVTAEWQYKQLVKFYKEKDKDTDFVNQWILQIRDSRNLELTDAVDALFNITFRPEKSKKIEQRPFPPKFR